MAAVGFYVKTGQIISTRVDIFPVEYTSKLASTLDNLDPLPAKVIRGILLYTVRLIFINNFEYIW
jgi:predicted unusual protein kinase regulating ubiquinone biosynthesis (AarF/ABC1/UbiB family)